MDKWFDAMIDEIKVYLPQVDRDRLLSAYTLSETIYKDRIKNEKYNNFIFRPRDVVKNLISLKPDEDTVVAAFLYDLLDSGRLYLREIEEEYGEGVVSLLEGLQILKSIMVVRYQSTDKLDLLRKLFLVMAKDIRVLVIFLSVKVVQMDLLEDIPSDCGEAFATEVLEIFVPIAARLGIYRYKMILEDKSFKILHSDDYKKIHTQVGELVKKKNDYVDSVSKILADFYSDHGFGDVKVSGRLKGYYSIHNKMKKKGLPTIDGIYDVFAFRVVLPASYKDGIEEDVARLYESLGMLHSAWRPIPSRFKDFVAVPKPNGYRSLHTTIVGLSDGTITYPVEVQIRSDNMHEEAEYGVASHWLYKDTRGKGLAMLRSHAEWLKNLAFLHSDMMKDEKVLDSVKLDLFGDRIYVLTPKGEVKELPSGATPLDFAYLVHTDIGHSCVLAKVNGKPTPLGTQLKNGDTVEIVTNKNTNPKLEWLSIVNTSQAKVKIRNWFASQDKQRHVKTGREYINAQLSKFGKPLLTPSLLGLKKFEGSNLTVADREKVLEEVGKGAKTASSVVRKIFSDEDLLASDKKEILEKKDKKRMQPTSERLEDKILLGGVDGLNVNIAKCCLPNFGDKILGYVSPVKDSATIHKKNCSLVGRMKKDRVVDASFKSDGDVPRQKIYRVSIKIEAESRVGLLGDIGSTVASNAVNIVNHFSNVDSDGLAIVKMLLDVAGLDQLERVLDALEKIEGVRFVKTES
jgi:GTP diphosphokinase / guanosine-3',5'-bis(diphosphate) 3'-diphosphatase